LKQRVGPFEIHSFLLHRSFATFLDEGDVQPILEKGAQQEGSSKLTLSNLQIHDAGPQISVSWTVSGDAEEVRAYQVEQKSDGQWIPAGNYIPTQSDQNTYKQSIDRNALVAKQVDLHIRAIGPDGNALAYSEAVQLKGECESKLTLA
jgi:hypothetical protein